MLTETLACQAIKKHVPVALTGNTEEVPISIWGETIKGNQNKLSVHNSLYASLWEFGFSKVGSQTP